MKKKLAQYHEKIDKISSALLLYFCLVIVCICIFSPITNEYFYALMVTAVPFFIILPQNVRYRFNKLLHRIFGFTR